MSKKFPMKAGELVAVIVIERGFVTSFSLGIVWTVERGKFRVAHAHGIDTLSKKPGDNGMYSDRDISRFPHYIRTVAAVQLSQAMRGAQL